MFLEIIIFLFSAYAECEIKAMSQTGLNLFIPMELLINSLNALSLSEKQQLWQILDEAIADAKEESWRENEC